MLSRPEWLWEVQGRLSDHTPRGRERRQNQGGAGDGSKSSEGRASWGMGMRSVPGKAGGGGPHCVCLGGLMAQFLYLSTRAIFWSHTGLGQGSSFMCPPLRK